MAVTKSILQNVRQQSVVKLINDAVAGTANITLLELKLSDEANIVQANCNVNIQTVIYSSSDSSANPIIIARGNTFANAFLSGNIMFLHGADSFEFTQNSGFHDKTLNSSNIHVQMPPQSMLYLVLGKSAGYQEPDQQTKF